MRIYPWKRFFTIYFLLTSVFVFGNGNTESNLSTQKGSISLLWWGNQWQNDRTNEAIQIFNRKNPGIQVRGISVDQESYVDRLFALIAADQCPDVIQTDRYLLTILTDHGLLVSVQDQPGTDPLGAILGLRSLTVAVDADSIPPIFTTFRDLANIGTAGLEKPDVFSVYLEQNNSGLINNSIEGQGWTNDSIIIDWFNLLLQNSISRNSPVLKSSCRILWTDQLDTGKYNYSLYSLPGQNGNTQETTEAIYLSIPESSLHKNEARQLIEFLTNNREAAEALGTSKGIPVNRIKYDTLVKKANEQEMKVLQYMSSHPSHIQPYSNRQTLYLRDCQILYSSLAEQVLELKMSPEEATLELKKGIIEILGLVRKP